MGTDFMTLFCHIQLAAGESSTSTFPQTPSAQDSQCHSLFSYEEKMFVNVTVLLHHRHPRSPRAPGELLHTTYLSEFSSESAHVTSPGKPTLHMTAHQQTCKNKWTYEKWINCKIVVYNRDCDRGSVGQTQDWHYWFYELIFGRQQ